MFKVLVRYCAAIVYMPKQTLLLTISKGSIILQRSFHVFTGDWYHVL